jgi:TRAP-type C4-dicarboxylate transport system permease large subunit
MCVIGLITPPVGVALYGVATVSKLPMERVFWATMPFFLALLGGVVLLVLFPPLVTALPKLLIR